MENRKLIKFMRNLMIENFKIISILFILSGFISIVTAYEESDLQWGSGVSNTLHLNDVISYNGYTVKVIGFPAPVESNRYSDTPSENVNPFVGLNVSKNGSFANNTVLGNGESYITPDNEMRIMVTGLPDGNSTEWLYESYDPWAIVELDPIGKPDLSLSIETDKSDYSSSQDTEINAYVTLTNSGLADVINVDLDIDTPFSLKNGSVKYHYERIKKGDSVTEDIIFNMPVTTGDKIYDINANVSAYDVKNVHYNANSSNQISVTVNPAWSMSLQKTTLEKIYLKDSAMISLDLKNNGKFDIKNVSISDSIPAGFELVSNTSLNWTADIPAGGEWNYRYIVEPLEPNAEGAIFPVAIAEFMINKESYGIRSNQPKLVVYGPAININKSALINNNIATVTVNAKNTGSTPTRVNITDELPGNTTLVGGITSYNEFLEAGKEVNFTYTLKINSNSSIEFPSAVAKYYKFGNKGVLLNKSSQKFEINTKLPTENITTPKIKPSVKINKNNSNISKSRGFNITNVTNVNGSENISTNESAGILDFISKIMREINRIVV